MLVLQTYIYVSVIIIKMCCEEQQTWAWAWFAVMNEGRQAMSGWDKFHLQFMAVRGWERRDEGCSSFNNVVLSRLWYAADDDEWTLFVCEDLTFTKDDGDKWQNYLLKSNEQSQ